MICQSAPPGRMRPRNRAPITCPPTMSMIRRSPYGVWPSDKMSATSAWMRKIGSADSMSASAPLLRRLDAQRVREFLDRGALRVDGFGEFLGAAGADHLAGGGELA